MRIGSMMRLSLAAVAVAGMSLVSAPQAQAQFGGQGGPPPGIMEKIKKWQKFNENHKKLSQLGDLIFQLGEMNKDPKVALDKPQSVKMLAIYNANKSKKELTEDQAGALLKQMTGVLNTKQIQKMTTIEPPSARMRRGFGGGGGGGRPGGGGPGGGAPGGGRPGGGAPGGGRPGGPMNFPDPPKNGWNPLNPDSLPFEQARPRAKANIDAFVGALQKKAKG